MCHAHRQWWSALLAVLKAGGAYVPLDPAYPDERLATYLRDTHQC
ncbi:AMP-binding protein [Xenorhabdus siamensis]